MSEDSPVSRAWRVLRCQSYRKVGSGPLDVEVENMIQAAFDAGRDSDKFCSDESLADTVLQLKALTEPVVVEITDQRDAAFDELKRVKQERDDLKSNISDLTEWLQNFVDEQLVGDVYYARVLGYVERMSGQ